MSLETDEVFAPLDRDNNLERIAGGNETEVYRTDDQRFVVKLKSDLGGTVGEALDCAREMRAAAEQFTLCLGPRYTIPNLYVVALDSADKAQVLVIQPFLKDALALHDVDYERLTAEERTHLAVALRDIIRRSLRFYRASGTMPDLYGRTSASKADRKRRKTLWTLPERLWSFLIKRNLLRAHNLMLTLGDEPQVVLIDYDFVRRSRLYRLVYFTVRWFLFWRDHVLIVVMRRSGVVPRS